MLSSQCVYSLLSPCYVTWLFISAVPVCDRLKWYPIESLVSGQVTWRCLGSFPCLIGLPRQPMRIHYCHTIRPSVLNWALARWGVEKRKFTIQRKREQVNGVKVWRHCAISRRDRITSKQKQTSAGLTLVLRLRRWPNINPTMGQCLIFTGFWRIESPQIVKLWLRLHPKDCIQNINI